MTNEQINEAIAELVNGNNEGPFPDYCNDLNAMHEAEAVIFERGLEDIWLDWLVKVVARKNVHWSDYHCFPQAFRATGIERREAFLLTFGKWEEQ
jgi:hypothetical protein